MSSIELDGGSMTFAPNRVAIVKTAGSNGWMFGNGALRFCDLHLIMKAPVPVESAAVFKLLLVLLFTA